MPRDNCLHFSSGPHPSNFQGVWRTSNRSNTDALVTELIYEEEEVTVNTILVRHTIVINQNGSTLNGTNTYNRRRLELGINVDGEDIEREGAVVENIYGTVNGNKAIVHEEAGTNADSRLELDLVDTNKIIFTFYGENKRNNIVRIGRSVLVRESSDPN